jgi:anti-sigma B factor antagonist
MDLDDDANRGLPGPAHDLGGDVGGVAARRRVPRRTARLTRVRPPGKAHSPYHSIRTAVHGDRLAVHVVGELDVSTIGALREVLLQVIANDFTDLVVVLSGVSFVDSTGLGVLVSAHKNALGRGGRLDLVVDQESVMKVFRITALNQVFALHRTLDAALAA